MENVLIFGATSGIAQATARLFAANGAQLHLVARNLDKLTTVADDLRVRGASAVSTSVADLNDFDRHDELIAQATKHLGSLDVVLLAHGTLGDQAACEKDFAAAEAEFRTNFLSTASLLTRLANEMEHAAAGTLAVISSVAGDRGRQSNYVYGTAKGAVSIFLQGLRNRLAKKGVHVLTIKPGFVDTPMTADLPQGPLFATPEKVGKDIVRAIHRKRNVIYTPFFWFGIMAIIRAVPEFIFKKLSL